MSVVVIRTYEDSLEAIQLLVSDHAGFIAVPPHKTHPLGGQVLVQAALSLVPGVALLVRSIIREHQKTLREMTIEVPGHAKTTGVTVDDFEDLLRTLAALEKDGPSNDSAGTPERGSSDNAR